MKSNFKIIFKTALWYSYSSILSKYGKKRQQLGMKSHFCCLWWWRFCIQGIWTTMNVFMWFMSYFERLTLIIFTKTFLEKPNATLIYIHKHKKNVTYGKRHIFNFDCSVSARNNFHTWNIDVQAQICFWFV